MSFTPINITPLRAAGQPVSEQPESAQKAILVGYQRAQQIQKQRNQEATTHVDNARRVVERYEGELKGYAELYARKLLTINIMAEKKAELDARIKSAREVLEEYETQINHDTMSDAEIQDIMQQQNKKEHTNGTRH